MSEQSQQEASFRALWTGKHPVDNVDGVPFVNVGTAEKPECVSAPVTAERLKRWMRLGYRQYAGETERVDQLLAESRQQAAARDEADKQTIASLEDSNRRLSADLIAARRKLAQVTDADQTGAARKITELAGELDKANRRIADIEASGAPGAGGQIAALQQQLDEATAKVGELQQQIEESNGRAAGLEAQLNEASAKAAEQQQGPDDQAVVAEILRIAGLDKGFKKELEALADRLTAPGQKE